MQCVQVSEFLGVAHHVHQHALKSCAILCVNAADHLIHKSRTSRHHQVNDGGGGAGSQQQQDQQQYHPRDLCNYAINIAKHCMISNETTVGMINTIITAAQVLLHDIKTKDMLSMPPPPSLHISSSIALSSSSSSSAAAAAASRRRVNQQQQQQQTRSGPHSCSVPVVFK
jgi:hypothetical protein